MKRRKPGIRFSASAAVRPTAGAWGGTRYARYSNGCHADFTPARVRMMPYSASSLSASARGSMPSSQGPMAEQKKMTPKAPPR